MRIARWVTLGAAVTLLALAPCHARAGKSGQSGAQPAPGAAYRLIELPSGRIIAEARPDILATPVAPGSLLKLATLVAAVESGLVDGQTRIACPRRVVVDGRSVECVHPDLHRPLSPAEALSYSCNGFFVTVARRLPRQSLDAVLVRLGLDPLAASAPVASAAIGLRGVTATPAQLLEAFLRVVGASRHAMTMPNAARQVLRAGTQLAARTGTASALGAAGFSGLAKTGTAPMPRGGYTGLVAAVINTVLPAYAIVVVAPGAAGSDAATMAAELLLQYGVPRQPEPVRVGIARRDGRYDISLMAVEEYVARVVAGEMGGSAASSALEAMAITARTFLETNRGRHEQEGFDLCDLSHCQVLGTAGASTDGAARATAGLVLEDRGRAAQVYYCAWCGGHTEKPSSVWPAAGDVSYLPAQPDPACAGAPAWRSEIAEPDLRRVLRAAGLSGNRVSRFAVASRHASGRAEQLDAGGMVPDHLDAGTFRTAAGRVLGWQTVKSTLFDVSRSSTGYVITGRGGGHGVGLCVLGAVNRARDGAERDQILAAYFPGLQVAVTGRGRSGSPHAPARTARIQVTLPEAERAHLVDVRRLAGETVRDLAARLGRPEPAAIDLVFHPTVESYARATGQPWWTSGSSRGTRIDLPPRAALAARGTLQPTVRHEVTHVLTDPVLADRPLWVREGLAVYLAGEAPGHGGPSAAGPSIGAGSCPKDEALRSPASAEDARRAYNAAGACVARALASGLRWQDLR